MAFQLTTEVLSDSVWRDFALYALVLNGIWEYAQLLPLYTCWDGWSRWQRLLFPLVAVAGDVVIVLSLAVLAMWMLGPGHLMPLDFAGGLVLVGLSFPTSVLLEKIALALGLWDYKPAMPLLRIGAWRVGLSPVLQITLLPALSVYLASL